MSQGDGKQTLEESKPCELLLEVNSDILPARDIRDVNIYKSTTDLSLRLSPRQPAQALRSSSTHFYLRHKCREFQLFHLFRYLISFLHSSFGNPPTLIRIHNVIFTDQFSVLLKTDKKNLHNPVFAF